MAVDRCTCLEQEDLRSRADMRRNHAYNSSLISREEAFSAGGKSADCIPFPLYIGVWDSVMLSKSVCISSSLNQEPQS